MSGSSALQAVDAGCYEATRAAALAGVPVSTVYDWARKGVVVPSISPVREKLWSYADLLALRLVSWLRHPKQDEYGDVIKASPMQAVREAIVFAASHGVDYWHPSPGNGLQAGLRVDRTARIWVVMPDGDVLDAAGDSTLDLDGPYLDLLAPFEQDDVSGPDLLRPRPDLRIVPAKVAGEPHVVDSRITSRSLAALARRGIAVGEIAAMYEIASSAVEQAVDLEGQLSLGSASAA